MVNLMGLFTMEYMDNILTTCVNLTVHSVSMVEAANHIIISNISKQM